MPAIISLILLRIAEARRKSRKLHSVALILSSPQSVLFSIYFLSKGEGPRVERRVFGEIGFISINDLTFTNWFYLEINLLESMQSVVFVLPASVLRFIFQYSFISLLWWHPAGGGLAAKTIYYPQSREDAQILSSSSWDFDSPRASIFAWSNSVCVISKLPTEYLSWGSE